MSQSNLLLYLESIINESTEEEMQKMMQKHCMRFLCAIILLLECYILGCFTWLLTSEFYRYGLQLIWNRAQTIKQLKLLPWCC